jgi:tellurite resistance protein
MTPSTDPLKYLGAGWFGSVMGLCGLSLAWHRAVPQMGDMADAAALVVGLLAAIWWLLLLGFYLLRRQRHPQATLEDFRHPVRHPLVATLPISLLLLAAVAVTLTGPSLLARGLWLVGAVGQFAVTLWVLGRWLNGNGQGGLTWAGVTPALILSVVGNVLVPLAGLPLGYAEWSAAQFGLGLFFWPLVMLLLFVPPAAAGLVALQWGAPALLVWMAWGVALFFLIWSAMVFRRSLAQPFSITFWALSFPLTAFCALTLRLGSGGPAWFASLGMMVLALSTLVVAALALATVKGLRSGSLLVPETVPLINATLEKT